MTKEELEELQAKMGELSEIGMYVILYEDQVASLKAKYGIENSEMSDEDVAKLAAAEEKLAEYRKKLDKAQEDIMANYSYLPAEEDDQAFTPIEILAAAESDYSGESAKKDGISI